MMSMGISFCARRIALKTFSLSSISMYRARGMPRKLIVSWRWMRVMTWLPLALPNLAKTRFLSA
ncbi:MAG: hypothetical protein A4E43_01161 [Methanosaeta sp. PtaB.Bin005]|nr:MAG: hypothetical protein A4E43_01161 [Methanosaeta sp. PtaB.Bin005]